MYYYTYSVHVCVLCVCVCVCGRTCICVCECVCACVPVFTKAYIYSCVHEFHVYKKFMCSHVRVCSMVNNAQSSQSTTSLPLNVFTRPSRLTQTHTQHTRTHARTRTHTHTCMYEINEPHLSEKRQAWMLRRVIHHAGRVLADTRHHQLPRVTRI